MTSRRLTQRSPVTWLVCLIWLSFGAVIHADTGERGKARARAAELVDQVAADPQRAKSAALRWLDEASAANRTEEQLHALLVLVEAEGRLEQPAEVARHADQGIRLSRTLDDLGSEARFAASRAYAGAALGESENGWPLHQRAVKLAESQNDQLIQAIVFSSYGAAALTRGTIEDAQTYLNRAISILQKHGPAHRLAVALQNLSDLHEQLGDREQARRDILEAAAALPPGRYPYLESVIFYNLGANFFRSQSYEAAKEHFERALAHSMLLNDGQGVGFAHQRLAMIANKQGRAGLAERHANEALAYFKASANQYMQLLTLLTLADVQMRVADRKSLETIAEARGILAGQDEDAQVSFYEQAGKTHARFGQFETAYGDMHSAYTISAELRRKQNSEQAHEQQARFDAQRREMENELLRKERSLQEARLAHTAIALQRRGLMLALMVIAIGGAGYALLVQIRQRKKLATLALSDELTGAPNRRSITLYAERQLAKSRIARNSVALAIADIDYFKRINDSFGHAVGDQVLKAFVAAVAPHLRDTDRLGRLGGEEFLLVLPNASRETLPDVFRRLQSAISTTKIEGLPANYPLTFSLGAVFVNSDTQSESRKLAALFELADAALYRAKNEGRNCLRISEEIRDANLAVNQEGPLATSA